MKKSLLFLLSLIVFFSCSKENDEDQNLSSLCLITKMTFEVSQNPSFLYDIEAEIDQTVRSVYVEIPFQVEMSQLHPTIEYSKGAKMDPTITVINGNEISWISLVAEDGKTRANYKVEIVQTLGKKPVLSKLLIDGVPCPFDGSSNTFYYPAKLDGTSSAVRKIEYEGTDLYSLKIADKDVANGSSLTFNSFKPKDKYSVAIFNEEGRSGNAASLVIAGTPLVNIYSENTIVDEPKVSCDFSLIDPEARNSVTINKVTTSNMVYLNTEAGIEFRGALSQSFEKKSFGVELWGDMEADGARLLGLREDQDWILDAMFIDQARMRNRVLTDVWNEMNNVPHFASEPEAVNGTRGFLVEVFLNNKYHGMYCMTERVDRKQLKCKKSGGQVFKSAAHIQDAFRNKSSMPASGTMEWKGFEVDYPKAKDGVVDWKWMHAFTQLIATGTDQEFKDNIFKLMDKNNYVDYFIFLQFCYGWDNSTKNIFWSIYNTTSTGKEKIFLTPWDLDATMGAGWGNGTRVGNPDIGSSLMILGPGTDAEKSSHLTHRLLALNPDNFKGAVKTRWNELKSKVLSMDNLSRKLNAYRDIQINSGASQREINRWVHAGSRYEDVDKEITYITNWMTTRIANLDAVLQTY